MCVDWSEIETSKLAALAIIHIRISTEGINCRFFGINWQIQSKVVIERAKPILSLGIG